MSLTISWFHYSLPLHFPGYFYANLESSLFGVVSDTATLLVYCYTFWDDGEHKPWTENHGKIIVSLSSFFLRLNLTVDASTEPQLSLYTPYTILCAQAALCEGVIVIILWGWLIARTTQAKPQMWHGHSS